MRRITFERRIDAPRYLAVAVPVLAFVAALVAGALLLSVTGHSAGHTYDLMVQRAFTDKGALSGTLIAATPLLFTGLAAAVAYRMGVFNIGGEGQLYVGAVASLGVGLAFGSWPGPLVIAMMVVAGAVGGAFWAAIAGFLKTRFNANEIITTLMLNYIAGIVLTYLIFDSQSYWRDLSGTGQFFPVGKQLGGNSLWPATSIGSLQVPLGFWIGIAAAVFAYVLYRSTRFGFQVRVIADAPNAAEYAGMKTKRTVLAVMALSGAFAGIGGASDAGDFRHVLDPKGIQQSGYGYTGIVVAALARLNPLAVVFVAVVLGGLNNAGIALQGPDFPSGLVGTLQGLILFFTLGGEILVRYRIRVGAAPRSSASIATNGDAS